MNSISGLESGDFVVVGKFSVESGLGGFSCVSCALALLAAGGGGALACDIGEGPGGLEWGIVSLAPCPPYRLVGCE